MIDVDNSQFGGDHNAAHLQQDGVAITMAADMFWDAVKGKTQISPDSVELALAAETAERMNEVMPVILDDAYPIDESHREMIGHLARVAWICLSRFHTVMLDDMLLTRTNVCEIYFLIACLRTRLAVAVVRAGDGRQMLCVNSQDYTLMFPSIQEFILDMTPSAAET